MYSQKCPPDLSCFLVLLVLFEIISATGSSEANVRSGWRVLLDHQCNRLLRSQYPLWLASPPYLPPAVMPLSHTLSMPCHLSLASPMTLGSGHKACMREASRVEEKGSVDTISLSTCSVVFLLNLDGVSTPSQASGILNCHVSKPVGIGNDAISVFFLMLYMQLESEHVESVQISSCV